MSSINIEGVGKVSGGVYDTLKVEGVGNCSSNIKAEVMHLEGVFNCSGEIEAKEFFCEGVANFKANIRAKRITVGGVLNQRGNAKIEAEEIICDGVIKTNGEISADIVRADGCIEAREIVGDQVIINSHYHGKVFTRLFTRNYSEVRLIEATTVNLRGIDVETVNGRDIIIGPKCRIDNIDCSGTLSIDITSYVRNITGNYTMK